MFSLIEIAPVRFGLQGSGSAGNFNDVKQDNGRALEGGQYVEGLRDEFAAYRFTHWDEDLY